MKIRKNDFVFHKMRCGICGCKIQLLSKFCGLCTIILNKNKHDYEKFSGKDYISKEHISMMLPILNWCDSFEENKKKYKEELNYLKNYIIIPYDCINIILSMTNNGATYKDLLLTCKYFHRFLEIDGDIWRRKFSNHLLTLIKFWPRFGWIWKYISENINISWEYIQENPHLPWNWDHVIRNPNITLDIVTSTPQIEWKIKLLSGNPNLTIEFIKEHNDINWNWIEISSNPGITLDLIEKHDYLPWNYKNISKNPNVTWENILKYPHYKWFNLGGQKGITIDIYRKYIDKYDWSMFWLSENPDITWDMIDKNPDLNWYYPNVSSNPNVSLKFVLENLEKFDVGEGISELVCYNPNITWQDVITYRNDLPFAQGLSINTYGRKFKNNLYF